MKPLEGAKKQIEMYKRMTGAERLKIAFGMWQMALEQVSAAEKAMHPELSVEEIEKRSRKRMVLLASELKKMGIAMEVNSIMSDKDLPNLT